MRTTWRAYLLGSMILLLMNCGKTKNRVDGGEPIATDECTGNTTFLIGSGIYDVTGPAAERGMMGYAMIDQKTAGIHMRLRSRAFVIASPCNGKRAVFVSADLGQIFQAVKQEVVAKLKNEFGDLYTDDNVLISATHTHSGPGGYSHYALYNLTTLGFDRQNFAAITDGIFQSIVRAHENLAPGRIKINSGELEEASFNRSPKAYLRNPETLRSQYAGNTDKLMTLLRFEKNGGAEIGTINWFPVHTTSLNNRNVLISGDNKGYASYSFEKLKGTEYTAAETFIAAFAQSHEGDISPRFFVNAEGAQDDFDNMAISGAKQCDRALELYNNAAEQLTGGVDYRHAFVDFSNVLVAAQWTDSVNAYRTTSAAIGISMIAGAEDGRGFGKEGWTCTNVRSLWKEFVCEVSSRPEQGEKPIVLEAGRTKPFPWAPEILPVQIVTIGNLALLAVPAEFTTMAGRKLLEAVRAPLQSAGIDHLVIAGLANAYAGYVTTREEYAAQHYEGASTHFGPWTLAAYQQEFHRLAIALQNGAAVDSGPAPRDLSCCQTNLQTGVVHDEKPPSKEFGSVHREADSAYMSGDTVSVTFWGGHPKNDFKIQSSFLEVQRKEGESWKAIAHDWDPETRYIWKREGLAYSLVTIQWMIPQEAPAGIYRIRHDGHWKSGWLGLVRPYFGISCEFAVRPREAIHEHEFKK